VTSPAGAPWVEGLSMVCHDLRRPLTVIRGAATLLMESHDQLPAANRAHVLGLIDQSAQTMADLVDDLALLARLEAGLLQVTLQPVHVHRLMQAAVDAVRQANPEVRLTVLQPAEIRVEADPEQSVRVLRALISTALQRSPEKSEHELSAEASRGQARILVALPSGEAIEEPEEPRSEPFSPSPEGDLGLPLHLSRRLARLMSGEVAVVKLPGGRSALSFTLNRRV
jgi:signal transduction histidine kinase